MNLLIKTHLKCSKFTFDFFQSKVNLLGKISTLTIKEIIVKQGINKYFVLD